MNAVTRATTLTVLRNAVSPLDLDDAVMAQRGEHLRDVVPRLTLRIHSDLATVEPEGLPALHTVVSAGEALRSDLLDRLPAATRLAHLLADIPVLLRNLAQGLENSEQYKETLKIAKIEKR